MANQLVQRIIKALQASLAMAPGAARLTFDVGSHGPLLSLAANSDETARILADAVGVKIEPAQLHAAEEPSWWTAPPGHRPGGHPRHDRGIAVTAPRWIAEALHTASGDRAGVLDNDAGAARLAAELLERLPMPAIADAVQGAVAAELGRRGLRDAAGDLARAVAADASRRIVALLADPAPPQSLAVTDRETYLDVGRALDACGVPRSGELAPLLTLGERVRWMGRRWAADRDGRVPVPATPISDDEIRVLRAAAQARIDAGRAETHDGDLMRESFIALDGRVRDARREEARVYLAGLRGRNRQPGVDASTAPPQQGKP